MAITPADIEKKTFSTALRGYDLDEVDDFLDEMVVAVRELDEELARARARVAELEQGSGAVAAAASPAPVPEAPSAPGLDESAVGRALVAAQQAADRILEEARSEAERVVGEARSEVDTFVRERDQRKAEVEAEMADMTGLVAGVRTQLAVLATTVADKLDEMDAAVAGAREGIAPPVEQGGGDEDSPGSESLDFDDSDEETHDEEDEDDLDDDLDDEIDMDLAVEDEDDDDDAEKSDETGLELDMEDMGTSDEEGHAGSSEIEGVEPAEEEPEI
jgi:DivIVA domain-containing protein